jgi:signal transduction histidine kinase
VRLREEFLSIASHEIRTPMTTITGFAHLLSNQLAQDPIDPSKVDMLSHRLLHEAERLKRIVTDLLDVSRIQQGQLELRPELCDLAGLARQVVERLNAAQDDETRREIAVHAPALVPGEWDPTRLDQVLTNLISNALKYSSHGPIEVTVEADNAGRSAVLSVRDHGVGIPKEQQARLFEPFVRGDSAHYSASGAGLGLYITRQIVEGHDGSITLDSNPGEGATFTVRLPLQVAE